MHDVEQLHYSTNEYAYNERLKEFKEKWMEYEAMFNYMNNQ